MHYAQENIEICYLGHPFLDACMRYNNVNAFTYSMLMNFIYERTSPPAEFYPTLQSSLATPTCKCRISCYLTNIATHMSPHNAAGLLSPLSSWYSYLFKAAPSANETAVTTEYTESMQSLSQLSLVVLLGMAIHTSPEFPVLESNPFRRQLATFTDLYCTPSPLYKHYSNFLSTDDENEEISQTMPSFVPTDPCCLSYSHLFDSLASGLDV